MKKVLSFLKRCRFLLFLLIALLILDSSLAVVFDRYTMASGNFSLNDYEITRRDHPEEIWDKVFYGNSAVVFAYREDLSDSGYINFGVVYGSLMNLKTILRSDEVTFGNDLVVGLNWAAMFDNMETNPNYFWNRSFLEPYSYFQRDRLYAAFTGKLKSLVTGDPWAEGSYREQTKYCYSAALSDEELADKVAEYEKRYWSTGIQGCSANLASLQTVIEQCQEKNIRLRVVLMPWNPKIEKPEVILELNDAVKSICADGNIEVLDLTDTFDADCFYDLGHMDYEYGSQRFMEVIDPWLP